jgi:hypothetical protein
MLRAEGFKLVSPSPNSGPLERCGGPVDDFLFLLRIEGLAEVAFPVLQFRGDPGRDTQFIQTAPTL